MDRISLIYEPTGTNPLRRKTIKVVIVVNGKSYSVEKMIENDFFKSYFDMIFDDMKKELKRLVIGESK